MLFTISVLGIFLSLILLVFNAGKYLSAIFLGLFFLIISLYGFSQYVLFYSKSVSLVTITIHSGFVYYLAGPMLFFYIRSILNDDARMKKRDLIHLLPMAVYYLFLIPFLFTPPSFKNEIARSLVNDPSQLAYSRFTILSDIFTTQSVFLSRPVLVFIYLVWSIGILIRFLNDKERSRVFSKQHYVKKWLIFFLGFMFILVVSHILLMLKPIPEYMAFNVLQIMSAVGLSGLLVTPFFFPGILYGLPRSPGSFEKSKETASPNEENSIITKKQAQIFESDYLLLVGEKSDSCMNDYKPFLQPDLNLVQFSVLVNIPVHHLAYYFREIKKQSFSDYRNTWRVNHAKELIRNGRLKHLTMEAIGLASGFKTRNTFFAVFKKSEGISPGAFTSNIH